MDCRMTPVSMLLTLAVFVLFSCVVVTESTTNQNLQVGPGEVKSENIGPVHKANADIQRKIDSIKKDVESTLGKLHEYKAVYYRDDITGAPFHYVKVHVSTRSVADIEILYVEEAGKPVQFIRATQLPKGIANQKIA